MEIKEIKFLRAEEWHVIKQINLKARFNGSTEIIGHIFYKRKLNSNYKLTQVREDDKDFNYRFNYPPQNIFPSDRLDEIILEGIKSQFAESEVYNHLITTTIDLENKARLIDRPSEGTTLDVLPTFKDLSVYSMPSTSKTYKVLRLSVNLYSYLSSNLIKNRFFVTYYEAEKEQHVLDAISKEFEFL